MPALVVATGNGGKLDVIASVLGPRWQLSAFDAGDAEDAVRPDYALAAMAKARAAAAATGADTILAHDCGFEFQRLGWEPGPSTARWLRDNVRRERLRAVAAGSRVRVVHCIALLHDGRADLLWDREMYTVSDAPIRELTGALPLTELLAIPPGGFRGVMRGAKELLEERCRGA